MLTVVGEIAHSQVKTYTDRRTGRPAYRLETVLHTDGADLGMTFFAKNQGTASWFAGRYAEGRRGLFVGQVAQFGGQWQLTNPRAVMFAADGSEPRTPTPSPCCPAPRVSTRSTPSPRGSTRGTSSAR